VLEARLAAEKGKVDTAKRLRDEGEALQGQGRLAEAAAKYRESLKLVPDPALDAHVKALETRLAQDSEKVDTAKRLRAEGEALQKQGKTAEAVAKYRESLKYVPDANLEGHARMLEAEVAKQAEQRRKADQLWQEGTALSNQGRPGEALAKFKESLKYSSSPERVKVVQDLEGRKTQAEKLRSEGASFQSQGKLREAAGKYRESLGYWPDPALADHIAKIEAEIKKQETQVVTQPPTSGSGGADGTWEVSFNNYRGKMELQRSGSSWSGRLWLDAHQRWEQLTNISYSSTGRLEFTRPISGATQRYSGALSGERLEGTFTQENSTTKYAWWANRTQAGTDKPTVSDAANASFPLQVVRNVPNQNSSAFKQNVRKDLTVDAARFDKIPYSMHVSSHDLMIPTPAKFCLAGDAGGTKGWIVDNFLLIEILDQSGNLISSALAGLTETVRRNGNPIETIGRSSDSFNACEIDVTKLLPVGKPFRLRASAMDYGYVGFVSDVFIVSPKGTSSAVSQAPLPSPSAKGSVIFNNGNTGGVYNNPSRATTFTLRAPHVITLITNYHWNNGRGATPGTIALRGSDGRSYGSWRTSGSPGQGGVPNAYWNAAPNVTLPAGTYTVVDSNPATWAQNSESGGAGHTKIEGYPSGQVR
jgi:tetratricopeptide (TPR) repeat protein